MDQVGIAARDTGTQESCHELTRLLGSATRVADEALWAKMLLRSPRIYQFEAVVNEFVAEFEAYAVGGPVLPLIDRYVVEEARFVSLLSDVFLLTVKRNYNDYAYWLECQVALRILIRKIYPIVVCFWGHRSEGSIILARVMLDGDDLDFIDFDELRTFCSDDFVPRRNSDSFASDQGRNDAEFCFHWTEHKGVQ